jgi:hypothetical protein
MNPKEMVDLVYSLDESDLRALNSLIVERIRERRKAENLAATFKIQVGSRVKWIGRPGKGLISGHLGTVTEVGRSRVSVRFDGDIRAWRCPAALLEIVSGPPELGGDELIASIMKPKEG